MKKLYFVLIGLLVFCGVKAQIINIPDANFKAKLLAASPSNQIAENASGIYFKIDANNDGEIQQSEALLVSYLFIGSSSITNLTGIEYFTNLTFLDCSYNQFPSFSLPNLINLNYVNCQYCQITTFNLSNLPNLQILNCAYNNLTTLTLSSFPKLGEIDCYANANLSSLNLSNLPLLTNLYCYNCNFSSINVNNITSLKVLAVESNHISSLNLNGLTNLTDLNCAANQLTSLDVNNFTNLTSLNCGANQITSLNVSNLVNLVTLIISSNQIQSIDVTHSPNLSTLLCVSNIISSFYLKNGYNYTLGTSSYMYTYDLRYNPVAYICADDNKGASLVTYFNSPTAVINSYCSFVPGGTYYNCQGSVRYDYNNNGCDTSDIVIPVANFLVTNNTNVVAGFSYDMSGNYIIPLQAGSYTITPILENPNYFNVSPTTSTVTFPATASPYIQDFCITPNGTHNDLEVMLLPIGIARSGFDAHYKIVYKNKGNTIQNGTINLTFNDSVLDYVAATPSVDVQSLNNLTWNFSNLNPFETRIIDVILNLNSPTEVPPLNQGDVLNYSATVMGLTDETPTDNTSILNQTVFNSFDPNYKTCTEGATVAPSTVGQYVHYMIGFENTGSANAQNIVVKDMIDTTKYDITTLVPITGSAPFTTRITNTNQVEFIFQNINLPYTTGSNDGYVAFKIKTKPTLVVGDTFSNTANIFFDYNAPIVTNTATTTIAALANPSFAFSDYFTLSPIPTKGELNITTKQDITISSISIYNTLGQVMLVTSNPSKTIDVSNLTTGSYFIKVITDKGTSSAKFMKE